MLDDDTTYRRTADEDDLTRRLRALRDSSYAVDPDEVVDLVAEIIDHIGSPDPELRDELGFSTLAELIVEREVVPAEHLRGFLKDLLSDDGINFHLGESGTDSVFRRSFSLLVLALIVTADYRREFLSGDDLREVAKGLIAYCELEADLRGRVPDRGWAHAMAHAADLADECMRHRSATPELAGRIAGGLLAMVQSADGVFVDEEDERIAIALGAVPPDDSASILRRWIETHPTQDEAVRVNWKHMVRSLYFRTDESETSARRVLAVLQDQLRVHG